MHALHAAGKVEIAGRVIMDSEKHMPVIEISIRLKRSALHYADADGGYLVAVPKDKARVDKLFPALLTALVECGNARVGAAQDEYYRSAESAASGGAFMCAEQSEQIQSAPRNPS